VKSINLNLNKSSFQLKISSNIEDLSYEWLQLKPNTLFSNIDYLKLLEKNGPIGYKYYYAVICKENKPIASVYFQRKRVKLSDDFRVHTHNDSLTEKLKVKALKSFFSFVKHDILICGNVLLTGEYAFGKSENFTIEQHLFDKIFDEVIVYIKNVDNVKIQSILCKDFFIEGIHQTQSFLASNFFEFQVQPAMIVRLDPEWLTYQDYLDAVKSKYRVKFKKVIKKGKALEFKKLDLDDVRVYNDQMYSLYKRTADRAIFSLFILEQDYFTKLKETIGDKLQITAVLEQGELLGFFTFVNDGDHGDAHFLGYDVSKNSKYQLYFNMLLRLIDESILQKSKYLNLSRTALEIKSSVGAEPHNMFVYLKHQNKLINRILPMILNRVVPKNSWEQRSPFK